MGKGELIMVADISASMALGVGVYSFEVDESGASGA